MGEACASESLAAPLLTKAQAAVASLPKKGRSQHGGGFRAATTKLLD